MRLDHLLSREKAEVETWRLIPRSVGQRDLIVTERSDAKVTRMLGDIKLMLACQNRVNAVDRSASKIFLYRFQGSDPLGLFTGFAGEKREGNGD